MGCQSNLKDLLGEYIRGQLPEEQAAAVRQHLTECAECASDAAQIETLLPGMEALAEEHVSAETLVAYAHSGHSKPQQADIEEHLAICDRCQSEVDRLKKLETESGKAAPATVEDIFKFRRRFIRILLPAAAVVFLFILFFKGFRLEFSTEQPAKAENNTLAVMYFENLADPEDKDRTAEMVTSLLTTDLSQSQQLRVISQQRLYDILKRLGREKLKVINKQVASEVAKQAGVGWLITGKVLQTKPVLVLTVEVSEVDGGKIKVSQNVHGGPNEDVFTVVDKLCNRTKMYLLLSVQLQRETDRPVANITTHSPDAFRYFLEAKEYMSKLYFAEAEKSYKKALSIDSTFASAYHELAKLGGPETQKRLELAVRYSDRLSPAQKYHLQADVAWFSGKYVEAEKWLKKIINEYPLELYAYILLGVLNNDFRYNPTEAIPLYVKAMEIDPLLKHAYHGLLYSYDQVGDSVKSLRAADKYIFLAPEEANPYDCKADIYANHGNLDEAIDLLKTALKKNPEFHLSLSKMGHLYLFKRDFFRAESCYKILASCNDNNYRSQGRLFLAYVPLYQGKFARTLEVLNQGIAVDEMEQVETWPKAFKHLVKAYIYEQQGNQKRMAEEAQKSVLNLPHTWGNYFVFFKDINIAFLAKSGDVSTAERMAEALKNDIQKSDSTQMWRYWFAMARITLAKNHPEVALANLEKAARGYPGLFVHLPLARAYLEQNRLDKAIAELEKVPSIFLGIYSLNQCLLTPEVVKSYYLLGLAYEKSGRNKEAIEKYQEFLDILKNADPGIPEVADAKERLERLKIKVRS
jgi:tetratricopeptide (TPR) repeat protein